MSVPFLSKLPLQLLVLAFVGACDNDNDDKHQDHQPPCRAAHDIHFMSHPGIICKAESEERRRRD